MLIQQTESKTWEALIQKLEHSKFAETYGDRVREVIANASKAVSTAAITKNEIPASVNEAAFERSAIGESYRFVERGGSAVGKAVGSAVGADKLLRRK